MRRLFGQMLTARRAKNWRIATELSSKVLGGTKFIALDVGAANGVPPNWRALDGVGDIYQVEPRAEACETLRAENAAKEHGARYHVLEVAVSGTTGERTLFVSNVPTGTSLLQPDGDADIDSSAYVDTNYFNPLTQTTIVTRRLDEVLDGAGVKSVDMIKLDIQGTELEALKSLGDDRLGGLLCAEMEIGLHELYRDGSRLGDYLDFMRGRGLVPFDFKCARTYQSLNGKRDGYRDVFGVMENSPTLSAKLWELDGLFFLRRTIVLERRDPALVRRMMIAYMTYNFFAEAYDLSNRAADAGIITAAEAAELARCVTAIHRARAYRPWYGNGTWWGFGRRIGEQTAPRNAPRWCQYMYQAYPNG